MSTNAVNVATTAGAKDKAAGGAGAQFFLGGILVLISTSWAASNIIKKNDPGYNYNPNAPISNQGMYHIFILFIRSHIISGPRPNRLRCVDTESAHRLEK